MTCPCDISVFPRALTIPAGLGPGAFQKLRTLGIFPQWRLSVLAAIGSEPALDAWRARGNHDLGSMLAEMGAYVFDVSDFYDALIAGETYLDTARLTGAQRKLVSLLGYIPRPAIGSRAYLAAIADGARVISLPSGIAFRSGAFDGNPPQVFELTQPTSIDPRVNSLTVDRVPQDVITDATLSGLLVNPSTLRLRAGDPFVLDFGGTLRPTRVASVFPVSLRSPRAAVRLMFTRAVAVPGGSKFSTLRLLGGGNTIGLWKLGQIGTDTETAISGNNVLLESRATLHAADVVLFENQGDLQARRVTSVIERQRTLLPALESTIFDASNVVTGSVTSPPITLAITRVALDSPLNWSSADASRILVHHPLSVAAVALIPLKDTLEVLDPISIPALIDPPRSNVTRLLLEDIHQEGVATSADAQKEWLARLEASMSHISGFLSDTSARREALTTQRDALIARLTPAADA